jgi:hypothetical protein
MIIDSLSLADTSFAREKKSQLSRNYIGNIIGHLLLRIFKSDRNS